MRTAHSLRGAMPCRPKEFPHAAVLLMFVQASQVLGQSKLLAHHHLQPDHLETGPP
jgi:hypothetical protein